MSGSSQDKSPGRQLFIERRFGPRLKKPGHIGFDELGNAQYQWQDARIQTDSDRLRALSADMLGLIDDDPPPGAKAAPLNKNGLRVGYNPYQSGRLEKAKKERSKPRDLRALSKWIQAKKNAQASED